MANSTISFPSEFTTANALTLLDKLMVYVKSRDVTEAVDIQKLSDLIGAVSSASFVAPPPAGGTLPTTTGNKWTILGAGSYNSGAIVVPANNLGIAYYNGSSWSVSNIPLPTASGTDVITPTGILLVNQKGVYDFTTDSIKNKADIVRINLFNKNSPDVLTDFNINPASGSVFASSTYYTTGWIDVEASTTYRMSYRNHLAWYDSNKVFISGVNFTENPALTLISPVGARYCRFGVLKTAGLDNLMFVKGTLLPAAYIPYTASNLSSEVKVTPASLSSDVAIKGNITQDFLSFSKEVVGNNLFNKNDADVVAGYYINPTFGVLSVNASYGTSGYVPIVGGSTYFFSQKTFLAWFDANKTYISGSTSTDTSKLQVAPANAKYVRTSYTLAYGVGNYYVNKDSDKGFSEYERYYLLKDVKAEVESSVKDDVLLFIPDTIHVAAGRTIELYYDQIFWSGDIKKYHFFFTGLGMTMERKWSITGTLANVGTYSVTCNVYDQNMKSVAVKTFTVKISNNTINTPFSVVPIGDSLTNAKPWIKEIVDNLSTSKISFTGTRFGGTTLGSVYTHEGRSGATANYYIGNNSYTFDTTGEAGIDGRLQSLNPFWNPNTSSIDWNYYKSNYSKNPNKIMIFLGTNGINIDPTTAVSQIKQLIDGLRNSGATSVPIYVVFTLFRSNQNGIAKQTGNDGFTASTTWKLLEDRKIFNLEIALHDTLKAYSNLHFIPLASCHDSEYNYGWVATAVNPRASQTVDMPIESIHPQTQGYMQFADIMFSVLAGTQ